MDDICNIGHGGNGGGGGVTKTPLSSNTTLTSGRKTYATLDIGSMGVDINTGPLTQINSANIIDNRRYYLKLSVFLFSFFGSSFFLSQLTLLKSLSDLAPLLFLTFVGVLNGIMEMHVTRINHLYGTSM